MQDCTGKKLLLVGGVRPAYVIVDEAHAMNIQVLTADYLEDSPCKRISDEVSMANATNPDEICELIQNSHVDGVMTGYVDMLLPFVEKACSKSGMPFWGDPDNIEVCIHKEKFKLACEQAGVSVVPWVKADMDTYQDIIETADYPVVIKPEDSSGGRGVSRCYSVEEAKAACLYAFEYSKNGIILIEKLMPADGEFSAYYMLAGGKAYLSAVGDKFFGRDEEGRFYEQGMLFPSAQTQVWIDQADGAMQRFFRQNRMTEGYAFIQGFFDQGQVYVHEIGFRLNGAYSYKLVEYFSGYNQVQELIRYALTGKVDAEQAGKSDPWFDGYGMIVNLTMQPGKVAKIIGLDQVKQLAGVINISQMIFDGENMDMPGTTAQDVAYIHCVAKEKQELQQLLITLNQLLHVYNEDGVDLKHPILSADVFKR